MQKLTVTARISHWTGMGRGSGYERGATISVTDSVSGVQFLEVEISPEDFYKLMSGSATGQTSAELRGVDRLDQIRDFTTVSVKTESDDWRFKDGDLPDRIRNYPVPDGYEGYTWAGAHRNNAAQWVITFDRWRKPTTEERKEHLEKWGF